MSRWSFVPTHQKYWAKKEKDPWDVAEKQRRSSKAMKKVKQDHAKALAKAMRKDKPSFKEVMQERSKELKGRKIRSETWFLSSYCVDAADKLNEPLGKYIPDIANHTYKYIVEIDGSIHKLECIKERDREKDRFYRQRGYKVFRVEHGDHEQKARVINKLYEIRGVKRDGKKSVKVWSDPDGF